MTVQLMAKLSVNRSDLVEVRDEFILIKATDGTFIAVRHSKSFTALLLNSFTKTFKKLQFSKAS